MVWHVEGHMVRHIKGPMIRRREGHMVKVYGGTNDQTHRGPHGHKIRYAGGRIMGDTCCPTSLTVSHTCCTHIAHLP